MFGECHSHIILDGVYYKTAIENHKKGPVDATIRAILDGYRNQNIIFIRDGGDNLNVSARAAQLAPEYGIDYRTPIFAIHKKGYYGSMVGRSFETMKDYHQLVKIVQKHQGDFIKVMFSGILDFQNYGVLSCDPIKSSEIKEMVHIAHEEGFAVMAHVNGSDTIRQAIEAGVDSIEHGYYLREAGIRELADTKIVWVPTFSPVGNMIGCGRFSDKVLKKILIEQMEKVKMAIDLNAWVALGSDAGAYMVPHSEGLKTEYRLMREAFIGNQAIERKESAEDICRIKQEAVQEKLIRYLKNNEAILRNRFISL